MEDPLGPARGILFGILLSIPIWAFIFLLIFTAKNSL